MAKSQSKSGISQALCNNRDKVILWLAASKGQALPLSFWRQCGAVPFSGAQHNTGTHRKVLPES